MDIIITILSQIQVSNSDFYPMRNCQAKFSSLALNDVNMNKNYKHNCMSPT